MSLEQDIKRLINLHGQCVAEGSKVTMGDGTRKPIDDLIPGDVVASSFDGLSISSSTVEQVCKKEHDGLVVRMSFDDGSWLDAAPDHHHFVVRPMPSIPCIVHRQCVLIDAFGRPVHSVDVYPAPSSPEIVALEQYVSRYAPRETMVYKNIKGDVFEFMMHHWSMSVTGELLAAASSMMAEGTPIHPRFGSRDRNLALVRASDVRTGDVVMSGTGDLVVVDNVRMIPYSGHVYALEVKGSYNYVAGGIVTHSSIFGMVFER